MALDFVRLARDYHLPYLESGHHHCRDGWVQTHCPICAGASHGWHLGVHVGSGNCNCWRCGSLKLTVVLTALLPDVSLGKIFSTYSTKGLSVEKASVVHATELIYPRHTHNLGMQHCNYLSDRRFDPGHLVREWGLRAVGALGAEWSWRIIIPIHNKNGLEVSYTGRAISETHAPRYLTLGLEESIENPKSLLYGEQYASETIVVVEGPTDVWRIGRGAVATFGTSWTEEQAARIRKYKTRYIMFDNEKPAQRLARKLADAVSGAPGTTEILTGLRTDPGDLEPEEVDDFRKELVL